MKKETTKISYDNKWALNKIKEERKLKDIDQTIRYLLSLYKNKTNIKQNRNI